MLNASTTHNQAVEQDLSSTLAIWGGGWSWHAQRFPGEAPFSGAFRHPHVGPGYARNPAVKSRLEATRVMTKMIQDTDAVCQVTIGEAKKTDSSFLPKVLFVTALGGATQRASSR